MTRILRILVALFAVGATLYLTTVNAHNFVVTFYVTLSVAYAAGIVLDWPHPNWLGVIRMSDIKANWSMRALGPLPSDPPVRALEHHVPAKMYFLSGQQIDDTEKLCNNYKSGYVLRCGLYIISGGVVHLTGLAGEHAASALTLTDLLKVGGALTPFFLTAAWDISRFERQRFANREVNAPSN